MNVRPKARFELGPLSATLALTSLWQHPAAALAIAHKQQTGDSSLKPAITTNFAEALWLSDAHWLDDHTLLVSSRVQAINLWSVAVEWWVEAAALVLAAILFWMLLYRVRRCWGQWRLAANEPHCRQCRYQLTGLDEVARCPECGMELAEHAVIYGHHSPFKSLAVISLLLVALGFGYFGYGHAIPRHGWVSKLFRWPSTREMNWAIAASDTGFVARHSTALVRVEAVDARTGAITSRLVTRLMFSRSGQEIDEPRFAILHQRQSILLMGKRDLLEFGIQSGRLRRRIHAVDPDLNPAAVLRRIVLDPQERYVCAILSNRESIRINLASGKAEQVVSLAEVQFWPDPPIAALSDPPLLISVRATDRRSETPRLELFDLATGETLLPLSIEPDRRCRISGTNNTVVLFIERFAAPAAVDSVDWNDKPTSCVLATWRYGDTAIERTSRLYLHTPVAQGVHPRAPLLAVVAQRGANSEGPPTDFTTIYGSSRLETPPLPVLLDRRDGHTVQALVGSSAVDEGGQVLFAPDGKRVASWATGAFLQAARSMRNCRVEFYELAEAP